jgi:hypothetical protein
MTSGGLKTKTQIRQGGLGAWVNFCLPAIDFPCVRGA